jgi:hypothetical protein
MNFKIYYMITLLSITHFGVEAQKIESDRTDKFTGVRTVLTKYQEFGSKYRVEVSGIKSMKDGKVMYGLSFATYLNGVNSIDKGEVLMMTDKDSIYTFQNTQPYQITRTGKGGYYTITFSEDVARKLAANNYTDIRLDLTDRKLDVEIKEKKRDLISKTLLLLINHTEN